jgi:hypothetical protein
MAWAWVRRIGEKSTPKVDHKAAALSNGFSLDKVVGSNGPEVRGRVNPPPINGPAIVPLDVLPVLSINVDASHLAVAEHALADGQVVHEIFAH